MKTTIAVLVAAAAAGAVVGHAAARADARERAWLRDSDRYFYKHDYDGSIARTERMEDL